jgi:predicted TIM-barrel fold metal-dependent hydrolase
MGTNSAWLDQLHEEPVEPDLPICDAHHHLWGYREGAIEPQYLIQDVMADIKSSGHKIVSTVFVEAKAMFRRKGPEHLKQVGEIEFVNGMAAMGASGLYGDTLIAAGIIGHTDLSRGAATGEVLDAMIEAAPHRFRGIRHTATSDPDPVVMEHRRAPLGMMMTKAYRDGVRELAKRQLVYEAWCFHTQLHELADLAREIPDVTIVLNHIGGPIGSGSYAGKRAEVFDLWKKGTAELATCPNVHMKLGGFFMVLGGFGWHLRPAPPSSDELAAAGRPYAEHLIEVFGPDRCMFESNYPVEKVSASYGVLWNALKKMAAGRSATEKAKLFHDTAVKAYRIAE